MDTATEKGVEPVWVTASAEAVFTFTRGVVSCRVDTPRPRLKRLEYSVRGEVVLTEFERESENWLGGLLERLPFLEGVPGG